MRAPYDGPDAEFVALVNESFVRTQLGGADPIDVIVRQSRVVNRSGDTREIQTRIVGVERLPPKPDEQVASASPLSRKPYSDLSAPPPCVSLRRVI